jgi:hypothetical protein
VIVAVVAGTLLAGGPAGAAVGDVSEDALSLGPAAVEGAGVAASRQLAVDAHEAGVAIGGAAATVRPTGRAAVATPRLGAKTWRWNGWVSGAAGPETVDGSFGTWRGKPLGLVGAWADRSEFAQTQMSTVESYAGFNGQMDIAVGALVRGETWQQAADGAFVTRWTTAVRNLRAMRGGKGTTYVRIAHEFNGDWMAWGVDSKNLAAYKKGWRLYASIVRKEFPQARIVWSPNSSNHTDVSVDDLWPGDDVVDVVAPDIYDFDPDPTTAASWAKETNAWLTPESPTGLDAWRTWAARRGVPLALAEWGLASGDDPEWIRRVHAVMAKYPAPKGGTRAGGRFVYDCYFNAETKFKLLGGPNAAAAAAYAALSWGS